MTAAGAPSIMVVEDNPTGRKMLRLAFEAEGYRVIEAPDGATALKRMEREPADLVIQDLVLPDIDGLELLRRLRLLPGGTPLPILALSGFRSILDKANGQPGGFTECLLKPIEPSRLVEIVRRHLPLPEPEVANIGKGRHILVVDDDAVQLRLTALRLRQLGFDVSTSGDGEAALLLAARTPPALILSDVLMPGLDGFELCKRARATAAIADVPVLLWSAHHGGDADVALARRVGARALLIRGNDFREVAEAIVACLVPTQAPTEVSSGAKEPTGAETASLDEQLARQSAANAALTRRCALHDAQLAIIGGVADALSRSEDVHGVLDDVLAACLDAGGISRGALYRLERVGKNAGEMLADQAVGFSPAERAELATCFGQPGLLDEVKKGQTVLPSRSLAAEQARTVLERARARSLVLVPLMNVHECSGALLLASDLPEIGEEDLLAFGRPIGAYINQALGLAAAFARLDGAAEVQRALFASLDIDETSRTVARLGTQHGDRCQVDLLMNGMVIGSAVAQRDPSEGNGTFPHDFTVPLVANGASLGVIRFARAVLPYGPAERRACEDLARSAAAALHKAQLYQDAQAANVAKDEFLGTMSHELRTPLTAILLWADKLGRSQKDPAVLDRGLGVIHKNARLQSQLIEDILDASRIVTGKLALQPEPVDLEVIAKAAIQVVAPSAEAKGITIELRLDPAAGMIVGDPGRLQQVIWNLLTNAVKFTPTGGQILVTLERRESTVDLRVKDTGKGIQASFLPFVFERFRQADNTSTRSEGGLGLGLALVKNLVESHGGSVRAESAGPQQGATFILRLPVPAILDARLPDRPAETPALAPIATQRDCLRGLRLLVVDDEFDVREMIADLLSEFGAEVRAVGSVEDAMVAFEEFKPTLLVSDLGMPKQDGFDLIRRIRVTSAIPALALTAYVGPEDKRRVLTSGFQMHMPKPVKLEALLDAITGLAAQAAQRPPL